jgi:hypothetical protein
MTAKVTRIEELEKELASIRAHHAKSSQEKDEAISLVKSRDEQIKGLHETPAVYSSRNLSTECAPKNNSGGNSEEKKVHRSKSSTPRDQIQSRAPAARPVAASTGLYDYLSGGVSSTNFHDKAINGLNRSPALRKSRN